MSSVGSPHQAPRPQTSQGGSVSPTDILTTLKNLVNAINGAAQAYLNVNGTQTAAEISATTLLSQGAGRLATVCILAGGSSNGAIYDTNSPTNLTRQLFTIPNTLGTIHVNLAYSYGLLVVPGTGGIVVTVGYS